MLRRVASLFVLAFLVVLAMLFVALNQQHFEVDVAFLEFDVSSGLALLIAFAAGLLAEFERQLATQPAGVAS